MGHTRPMRLHAFLVSRRVHAPTSAVESSFVAHAPYPFCCPISSPLPIASQLACESDEGERRDALIHQLMKVTRGIPRAPSTQAVCPRELHDGAASDDSEDRSASLAVGQLDLERGVDDLIAAATAGRGSTGA